MRKAPFILRMGQCLLLVAMAAACHTIGTSVDGWMAVGWYSMGLACSALALANLLR